MMHFTTYKIHAGFAFQTSDGLAYTLRRVTQADAALLNTFLQRLSDDARWMRYMRGQPYSREFAHGEVARLLAGSTGSAITLVATQGRDESEVVAIAELVCDPSRRAAEVALVVLDTAQRQGIGSFLLRALVQIAQELEITSLYGCAFAANEPVRRLIRTLQLAYTMSITAGEMHVTARVPQHGQRAHSAPNDGAWSDTAALWRGVPVVAAQSLHP